MNVVMVSAEAGVFAKTGGLADAVWSLAKVLTRTGVAVSVVLPRYRWIDPAGARTVESGVSVGLAPVPYRILETRLDDVTVDLVESQVFADREGIYGPDPFTEYPDNALRFAVLGQAALAVVQRFRADDTVIHGHDWPAGVALAANAESRQRVRSVLTIHNARYAGYFAKHDLHYTGLPPARFQPERGRLRETRTISYLLAGILASDAVTTVSPGYAQEILSGAADAEIVRHLRRSNLTGIVNGADYEIWDPARDRLLPARYTPVDLTGKRRCTEALRRRTGLADDPAVPVIGMVARLVDQKGLEELCFPRGGALAEISRGPVQIVILGTGDRRYEEALAALAAARPNVSATIGFDEGLAHLIEAGSDYFLMPSRFEPCGLNQLYSLRYGTVPIVHRTGGLADTVRDVRAHRRTGTGWVYRRQAPGVIARTVGRAVRWAARHPEAHRRMILRGMHADYSWEQAAASYLEIYRG